jgi:hypothetical protein
MDRWMKSLKNLPKVDQQDALEYNPTIKMNNDPKH